MPRTSSFLTIVVLGISLALAACREEGDIKIASLKLVGVKSVDEGQLANALQTRKGSRLPWGRKRFFDRRAFEADLKRLQAFYRDRGFPDARVASFDVKLNDKQDQADITITISEGEPVRVAAIDLQGVDVLPENERKKLLESMPLRPEQPLDRQQALAARERVVNALRDRGYAYAEVQLHEEPAGPKRSRLTLRGVPGPLAYFGPIEITGNKSVDDYVIERQLTYKPGDLFKRTEMRESQRKLYRMELFEFANIETSEDRDKQPLQIPTRVTVAEGKHQRVTFGVGYGTEEQVRTRIRWDHLNFTGGARHVGFEGKWSSLDRGVRMDFQQPYFFGPHFSLGFRGEAWQAREVVYSANRLGGRATLTHQANSANKWSVSLIDEFQRSSIDADGLLDFTIRDELISLGLDPRTGQQEGTLSAVAFDISRTTANSVLDARHGYVLSGHVEQAGTWLWGDFNYWLMQGEARHYLPIGRTLVVANRLGAGTIDGRGDLEINVPFYKRYFLGGASSVRGWGRFEVGPLSGFGLPIGGHTFLEGSSEARMPVRGKLGAVLFLDYGNVWPGTFDFALGDLRYAVGPGLRYLTPIGPARIDFGWQLNPIDNLKVNGEPERRHWRVHFSIGQAF
jgi:outer membrane protein insertion porin family/translocation and assembly module TamA